MCRNEALSEDIVETAFNLNSTRTRTFSNLSVTLVKHVSSLFWWNKEPSGSCMSLCFCCNLLYTNVSSQTETEYSRHVTWRWTEKRKERERRYLQVTSPNLSRWKVIQRGDAGIYFLSLERHSRDRHSRDWLLLWWMDDDLPQWHLKGTALFLLNTHQYRINTKLLPAVGCSHYV